MNSSYSRNHKYLKIPILLVCYTSEAICLSALISLLWNRRQSCSHIELLRNDLSLIHPMLCKLELHNFISNRIYIVSCLKLSGGYLYIDTIYYTHDMLSCQECPRDAVRAQFWRDRDMHTAKDTVILQNKIHLMFSLCCTIIRI